MKIKPRLELTKESLGSVPIVVLQKSFFIFHKWITCATKTLLIITSALLYNNEHNNFLHFLSGERQIKKMEKVSHGRLYDANLFLLSLFLWTLKKYKAFRKCILKVSVFCNKNLHRLHNILWNQHFLELLSLASSLRPSYFFFSNEDLCLI